MLIGVFSFGGEHDVGIPGDVDLLCTMETSALLLEVRVAGSGFADTGTIEAEIVGTVAVAATTGIVWLVLIGIDDA